MARAVCVGERSGACPRAWRGGDRGEVIDTKADVTPSQMVIEPSGAVKPCFTARPV